jgi:hypothetical protein
VGGEEPLSACLEDNASKPGSFCLAGPIGFGVFTGLHCEEKGAQGNVGCVSLGRVLLVDGPAREKFVEFPKTFWCDCFLVSGRRVGIVECFQKGSWMVGSSWECSI